MNLSHRSEHKVLIITLEEDVLDAKNVPEFKEEVKQLIQNNQSRHVILDLHQLQFIDSSGLGSILSVLRSLTSAEGDLKIASMTKPVRAIFELVNMHKIFKIYNTTEDALHACMTVKH